MSAKGTLYLLPCTLGERDPKDVIPREVFSVANELEHFIVEDEKSARRFLSSLGVERPIRELSFSVFNEQSDISEVAALIQPLLEGKSVGLLSEAGCPSVADPGEEIVREAHRKGIQVKPLVGPCSILLALIGSGLPAESFSFHGYLPKGEKEREEKLRELEERARKDSQTQIFMETPYRSAHMLESILKVCRPETELSVCSELTLKEEEIQTKSIAKWRDSSPKLSKRRCIFLISGIC